MANAYKVETDVINYLRKSNMAKAYWVRTANWRTSERMNQHFYRLNKEWAYSVNGRGNKCYWHTRPIPETKPEHQQYVTFERLRWERAGDVLKHHGRTMTRKTCEMCRKRIPVSIRVMFELKGT